MATKRMYGQQKGDFRRDQGQVVADTRLLNKQVGKVAVTDHTANWEAHLVRCPVEYTTTCQLDVGIPQKARGSRTHTNGYIEVEKEWNVGTSLAGSVETAETS